MGGSYAEINMGSKLKILFIGLLFFHLLLEFFEVKIYPSFLFPQFYASKEKCFCRVEIEDTKGEKIEFQQILDTKEKKIIYTYKNILCSNNTYIDTLGTELLAFSRKKMNVDGIIIKIMRINDNNQLIKVNEYHYEWISR